MMSEYYVTYVSIAYNILIAYLFFHPFHSEGKHIGLQLTITRLLSAVMDMEEIHANVNKFINYAYVL